MKAQLREMLFGQIGRLRYVGRFSTMPMFQRENVAEHTFYTAFYTLCLMDWFPDILENDSERARVLEMALLHDVDESASGDMIRRFKYSSTALMTALDEACAMSLESWSELIRGSTDGSWLTSWRNAKNKLMSSGRMVALADFLSVLSTMATEISSGNKAVLQEAREGGLLVQYAISFDTPAYHGEYSIGFIADIITLTKEVVQ